MISQAQQIPYDLCYLSFTLPSLFTLLFAILPTEPQVSYNFGNPRVHFCSKLGIPYFFRRTSFPRVFVHGIG